MQCLHSKFSRTVLYSDAGLDHSIVSKMEEQFSSQMFFAVLTNDLQNTSLHSLVFILSVNITFAMVIFFAASALWSKWTSPKTCKYLTFSKTWEKMN